MYPDPPAPLQPLSPHLPGWEPPAPPPPIAEPGNRKRARLWWAVGLVLYAVLVLMQQGVLEFGRVEKAKPDYIPPPSGTLDMQGKLWVKMKADDHGSGAQGLEGLIEKIINAINQQSLRSDLDDASTSPTQSVRVAILAGELLGPADALKRLDAAAKRLAPESPVNADIPVLRAIYEGHPLDDQSPEAQQLIKHHEYFGKVAVSYGKPDNDPLRQSVLSGRGAIMALGFSFFFIYGGMLLIGTGLLLVAIILFSAGRMRARLPRALPASAGSIGVEMFVVFVAAFLLLKLIASGVVALTGSRLTAMPYILVLQGLMSVIIFYPVLRGMTWSDARRWLGLHGGTGVIREIGAGVLGYLACLPLLIVGVLFSFLLMAVWSQLVGRAPAPDNQIVDLVGGDSVLVSALTLLLALVWAPIVEESVFRGALFRECRAWTAAIPAALVTAFFFAFAHGYPIFYLPILMGLASGFAMLRYWRGSLIGCITAHFIHNSIAMTLAFALSKALGS